MTTETETEERPRASCSNCGDPVLRRRPSLTGKHFCSKKLCERAKQRFYYERRVSGAAESEARQAATHRQATLNFLTAALHGDRIDCDTCGRVGVIPRYAHPVPDWSAPCNPVDRLPISGDPSFTTELMRVVYPS